MGGSYVEILHETTSFISDILARRNVRHNLFSSLRREISISDKTALKTLDLAAETLETAVSTTNSSIKSTCLRRAKNLLLSQYPENIFSSFLLSLVYRLYNEAVDSSLKLLQLFDLNPSFARTEIAPTIFEKLFLIHLLPVIQWFNAQRSNTLSSLSTKSGDESDDFSVDDVSAVVPYSKRLSKVSGDLAVELKELERNYEEVIDVNCRVIVGHFRKVLKSRGGGQSRITSPPAVVLRNTAKDGVGDKLVKNEGQIINTGEVKLENQRFNPIWAREKNSINEFHGGRSGSGKSKSPPFYPQRVSPTIFASQNSSKFTILPDLSSCSELESSSSMDCYSAKCSSESEAETELKYIKMALLEPRQNRTPIQKRHVFPESSGSPDHQMADTTNPPGLGKHTPPKDFVCPITSHIFEDPVTLETGQTYERTAIQEWINRGNSTCPITRNRLLSTQLPKTNYVLKRLIASWQEDHISTSVLELKPMSTSTSPDSVISQAISLDCGSGNVTELREVITSFCMSEILQDSEIAVLRIERFWQEANMEIELEIQTLLCRPPVINGFVEILLNSVDFRVLEATVFLLSELGSRDVSVIQTLTRVDSDVECILALFKKGLLEAVVLIHLLRPSSSTLIEMDIVEPLLKVIKRRREDLRRMCLDQKAASVILLGQVIGSGEEGIVSLVTSTIVSSDTLDSITSSLTSALVEERIAAVGILRSCMQYLGQCRNIIADKAELALVMESFAVASDEDKFEIVCFLSELIKLSRTCSEQILRIIRDEGRFSTMRSLLVYLQTAAQDQCPVIASLLLQLDLLDKPRKMSMYREEAIDSLILCLRNSDFPAAQIAAAETIMSMQGRFTAAGEPLTRAILLKRAGIGRKYRRLTRLESNNIISGEIKHTSDEEKAAEEWEREMAYVMVSHEFGLVFEALAEGLKSSNAELCAACFESATWLVYMLSLLPDTGIIGAARVCLFKTFISIFKSTKDTEDRALSLLALRSFMQDPEGLRDLTSLAKDILSGLRELRKSCPLALEMLRILSEGHDSSADFWNHKELVQVDSSANGAVLSIVCFRDKIFSGHSDGTIKVWTGKGSILHLVQEIREHNKAVTSLAILQSGERLYSGSLDKTARVWSIGSELIDCVQVLELKDQVQDLVVAKSILCFIPQGAGIKVTCNEGSKLLNSSKYVKCLALVQGKLYCGCHDNSIQEIDLATGTLCTIQTGCRKLIGKADPIHALLVRNGLIYSLSSHLDSSTIKMWSASNYEMVGSIATTSEVRAMAISTDLVYLGCKGGTIEIWDGKKQSRIETLQTGTNGKVLCMALDENEEVLVIGTSDGRIQAWGLS